MTKLTRMEREALDSIFLNLPVHREGLISKIRRLFRKYF